MSKKSKDKISQSLLEILEYREFQDITISEILDNTTLVRKTFYNNFSTKMDIVEYIGATLVEEYIERIKHKGAFTLRIFATELFQFFKDKEPIFRALFNSRLFYVYRRIFETEVPRISQMLPRTSLAVTPVSDWHYVFAFHQAGVFALTEVWFNNDFDKDVSDLADLYLRTIRDTEDFSAF